MASEIGRFPRLFRGAGSIAGLTWPTMVFKDEMTVMLGKLVEYEAGIYTGDAHLEEWPNTLEKLRALKTRGIKHPRIWTAKRDREMWKSIG